MTPRTPLICGVSLLLALPIAGCSAFLYGTPAEQEGQRKPEALQASYPTAWQEYGARSNPVQGWSLPGGPGVEIGGAPGPPENNNRY